MESIHSKVVLALLDALIERHSGDEKLIGELLQVRAAVLDAIAAGDRKVLRARLLSLAAWVKSLLDGLDGP